MALLAIPHWSARQKHSLGLGTGYVRYVLPTALTFAFQKRSSCTASFQQLPTSAAFTGSKAHG
jgi:hypothetical protein